MVQENPGIPLNHSEDFVSVSHVKKRFVMRSLTRITSAQQREEVMDRGMSA